MLEVLYSKNKFWVKTSDMVKVFDVIQEPIHEE